jgi:hypothetical protein
MDSGVRDIWERDMQERDIRELDTTERVIGETGATCRFAA